jgi:predicted dehydrogenase
MKYQRNHLSRRRFLSSVSSTAAIAAILPRFAVAGSDLVAPSDKLRLAFIGVGGRGRHNINKLTELGNDVVAISDVDAERAKESLAQYSKAKTFVDYRRMLDAVENQIDGVVVSTPDHTHAVAAMDAIRRGKHVYCEKPLAHSISEVRALQKAADEEGVITQLGNQGHSFDHIRLFCEWIWDGAIGDVHTIHVLRPSDYSRIDQLESLSERPPVPETLDWDLWLGPAIERPYHSNFLPGSWRGWSPFGTGVIGDWTCHVVDPVFWALDLGSPTSIVAQVDGYDVEKHALTFPRGSHVTYEFAAKDDRGPVTMHWYDGSLAPPSLDDYDWSTFPNNTCGLVIGTEGAIRYGSHGASGVRIMPEEKMLAYKRPDPTIPRVAGHHQDWVDAVKSGSPAGSNFDYGGRLTELALLGVIATRHPEVALAWDGSAGRFTNSDEANRMVAFNPRKGWRLPN